jgi:anti-sigma B factor antagonist
MGEPVAVTTGVDGTLNVALLGEIDFSNSSAVVDTVGAAVTRAGGGAVCVDLSSVTFLDSSGVGVLVWAYRAATENGATYRVVHPNGNVYEQLRLTGLADLFDVEAPARTADGYPDG